MNTILLGHDGRELGETQAEIDGSKIPLPGQVCFKYQFKQILFEKLSYSDIHTQLLLVPEDRQHPPHMRSSY